MFNLLVWIVFGGLVGWVASIIMGTNRQQGIFLNVIVGIMGVLIGGVIARTIGVGDVSGLNLMSFLIALGGAIILLAITRMFSVSSR